MESFQEPSKCHGTTRDSKSVSLYRVNEWLVIQVERSFINHCFHVFLWEPSHDISATRDRPFLQTHGLSLQRTFFFFFQIKTSYKIFFSSQFPLWPIYISWSGWGVWKVMFCFGYFSLWILIWGNVLFML